MKNNDEVTQNLFDYEQKLSPSESTSFFSQHKNFASSRYQLKDFAINFQSTSFTETYLDNIITQIIADVLSSLTKKPLFEDLYKSGLIFFLKDFIKAQEIKGTLYFKDFIFENENTKKAVFLKKRDSTKVSQQLKTLEKIDFNLKINNDNFNLISCLKEICFRISMLHNHTKLNLNLSNAVSIKIDGLRSGVPIAYKASVDNAVRNAIGEVREGKASTLIIDGKDSVEVLNLENQKTIESVENYCWEQLSNLTQYPKSFFSGETKNGLNSNVEGTRDKIIMARQFWFLSFIKPFFDLIDIEIYPTINYLNYFTPESLIELCQIEKNIDKLKVYSDLGLPLNNINVEEEVENDNDLI
jgi:hypothetical protein